MVVGLSRFLQGPHSLLPGHVSGPELPISVPYCPPQLHWVDSDRRQRPQAGGRAQFSVLESCSQGVALKPHWDLWLWPVGRGMWKTSVS